MSNYISAVTLASPTQVASSSAPQHSAVSRPAQKIAVQNADDAQVTLSSAALAYAQNGTPTSSTDSDSFTAFANVNELPQASKSATQSADHADQAAAPSAKYVDPRTKYVDPRTEHDAQGTAARVKLSTAAQVLSMNQTGSSVDEIAAILGMTVSQVSEELGQSSTSATTVAVPSTPTATTAHD